MAVAYGGYAAPTAVALEPSIYRCAVAVAGISDLGEFFADKLHGLNSEESVYARYFSRFVGINNLKDPLLNAISPAFHIDAITAPVLLIHGRDDTVVPFKQSQLMANGLKMAGKQVDLVELKNEDHWMSRSEARLQMLDATVTFLKNNNSID